MKSEGLGCPVSRGRADETKPRVSLPCHSQLRVLVRLVIVGAPGGAGGVKHTLLHHSAGGQRGVSRLDGVGLARPGARG